VRSSAGRRDTITSASLLSIDSNVCTCDEQQLARFYSYYLALLARLTQRQKHGRKLLNTKHTLASLVRNCANLHRPSQQLRHYDCEVVRSTFLVAYDMSVKVKTE